MDVLAYPLAFLLGLAFNFNPSCGSATAVWVATQKETHRLILLVSIRIAIFAAMGAAAGLFGAALRPPWGALMLATAAYLLFSTVRQLRHGAASTCSLPHGSQALPWLLAAAPPPSAYIGLAIFFGGVRCALSAAWRADPDCDRTRPVVPGHRRDCQTNYAPELVDWVGHSPERLQAMRDGLDALKRQGAAQIED